MVFRYNTERERPFFFFPPPFLSPATTFQVGCHPSCAISPSLERVVIPSGPEPWHSPPFPPLPFSSPPWCIIFSIQPVNVNAFFYGVRPFFFFFFLFPWHSKRTNSYPQGAKPSFSLFFLPPPSFSPPSDWENPFVRSQSFFDQNVECLTRFRLSFGIFFPSPFFFFVLPSA